MRPILRVEIMSVVEYEKHRDEFRGKVIADKRVRRVDLGEQMSAVFENRDTVKLQVLEMMRIERLTSETAIAHEIATFNELVPGDDELSLTAYVDNPDKDARDRALVELAGLEEAMSLEVDGVRFALRGRPRDGAEPGRTTAVHYLKAKLTPEAAAAVRGGSAKISVVVDHPKYHRRADLGRACVEKLGEDLAA